MMGISSVNSFLFSNDENDSIGLPSLPALGPVLSFLRLLWAVDHTLQRSSKRIRKERGVTGPQRLVVCLIGRFPSISSGKLADILHLHPSTLTGILKRLERKGLIDRCRDPRDGRRFLLGLTVRGHRIDVETEGTVEAAIQTCLQEFPPETIQAVRQVLARMTQVLEANNGKDR